MNKIFHNKFIEEKLGEGINLKAYKKFLGLTVLGSIPMIFILKVFGDELFVIFLGEKWFLSGQFVTLLAPLALSKLLLGPALSYFLSHERVTFLSVYRSIQLLVLILYFSFCRDVEIFTLIQYYVWIDFSFDAFLVIYSYVSLKKAR